MRKQDSQSKQEAVRREGLAFVYYTINVVSLHNRHVLRRYLTQHQVYLRSKDGQNFLCSKGAIDTIVKIIYHRFLRVLGEKKATKSPPLLYEIGPGLGALTLPLAQVLPSSHIVAFELDGLLIKLLSNLIDELNEQGALSCNISLIRGDALRTLPGYLSDHYARNYRTKGSHEKTISVDKSSAYNACQTEADPPWLIVGNLPYSCAIKLIISHTLYPALCVPHIIMLQKEAFERISATTSSKQYAASSIIVQSHYSITKECDVDKECFFPRPSVNSVVCTLTPRLLLHEASEKAKYHAFVNAAFSQRRKKLKHSLRRLLASYSPSLIPEDIGFSSDSRAETYPPEVFLQAFSLLSTSHK